MIGWLAALAAGCVEPPVSRAPARAPASTDAAPSGLGALSRLSLDLRGVRPTVAELEAAEAAGDDPAAWAAQVDTFLHDPRFGARVRDLYSGIYLTRQDAYAHAAADYGVDDDAAFVSSIGEEPLRILSTIAEQDLPYTEIATADWTMADEVVAAAAPVDYPKNATGWARARYTDGRPSAGILATNGLWWHYTTSSSNLGRARASAMSRILLCQDYLSRAIPFDRSLDLLDPVAMADALHTEPGCVACHNTLDPLASYIFGFYPLPGDGAADAATYHADREALWRLTTGAPPAYYGVPGESVADLGRQIAADPRLTQCVTRQWVGALLGREPGLDDTAALVAHREAMLAGGTTIRALVASIVATDAYRGTEGGVDPRLVSVEQLGTALFDLTGFRFTHLGYDLLGSDTYGVRTLAGGVDGVYTTRPDALPTATSVLVHARVTQAAAAWVAAHDRAGTEAPTLFTAIDFGETPASGRDAMVEQLLLLHLRLHGVRVAADGPEVDADLALWEELYALDGDPEAAWAGVLSVLLRDPAFLTY
ncbi:MAG: DUF1585 domain-containing protein [Pseudomonadota bacterium]|nr:DUF1585 domain-containing protein [Pseudomonadota bacterium]